jgi:hypothetical protein
MNPYLAIDTMLILLNVFKKTVSIEGLIWEKDPDSVVKFS